MVMVCNDHVKKGLRILPVPHVKKLPKGTKKTCMFCEQQAKLQLFLLSSSMHFVIPKEVQTQIESEDTRVSIPV